MTRILATLAEIAPRYEALLCDLWGCLHNGRTPFPAAVAALRAFRAGGGRVALVTNAPRPSAQVIAALDRMGVPRDAWDVVASSGDAAQYGLFSGAVGTKVWHIGPEKDDAFFTQPPADLPEPQPVTRVGFDAAEGIVCTGPFDEMTETPEDYRGRLLSAKVRGLPMLCTNPDIVVDYGETRIYCAGALAALYEEMGGRALYFGKPHPPIYDLARRRLAEAAGRDFAADALLAVGDGIGTDVQGGLAEGIDTLFVTGGLAAAEFGPDPEQPEAGLLAEWLSARQVTPTYAIGKLR